MIKKRNQQWRSWRKQCQIGAHFLLFVFDKFNGFRFDVMHFRFSYLLKSPMLSILLRKSEKFLSNQ